MSVSHAPSAPAVDAEQPRRRWPRRLILTTGLLLVTFLIGAGFAIAQYEPLEWDLTFGTTGVDYEDVETYGDPEVRILRYEHGAEFVYMFGLRNAGPAGVTVTGIETMSPSLESLVLTTEAMVMPVGEVNYSERAVRPLRPFALGPGEWRAVAVRARFQKCGLHSEPGLFQILESDTITFRVLGIPRQMEVPLPSRLVVESPPRSACPE